MDVVCGVQCAASPRDLDEAQENLVDKMNDDRTEEKDVLSPK